MTIKDDSQTSTTQDSNYTNRLVEKQVIWWKRLLDVQAPYRWNMQRLEPGLTLEIGCGIGRNLINLKGNGIGIDHNLYSVQVARKRGLIAFTIEEFQNSYFNKPQQFDSLLLSHVAEHMTQKEVVDLLTKYVDLLKPKGKLIVITPQEAGYKSDSTHVEFMNFIKLRNIVKQLKFNILQEYSFPFPRFLGIFFIYNEFVSVSRKL
ncbi:MAG: class I SAM-dependent methyltransferase [Coleofasciculus chthonoplastes F3-SA18-01]|uniref:class I SAM-dependent methyltransferase n=1 Tax=Coleofasciculus chthonoplastes TaxID=64178 RepID=UPI0033017BF0